MCIEKLTDIIEQDFCRLMYSHGSVHTEGIDVLAFIDDTFDQRRAAVGYHGDVYREHFVKVSTLPVITDEAQTSHVSVKVKLKKHFSF